MTIAVAAASAIATIDAGRSRASDRPPVTTQVDIPREALLARTMVDLADTLVADFDIVDLLTTLAERCIDVLDTTATGIMLVAADGELRVMTSSSGAMRVVELDANVVNDQLTKALNSHIVIEQDKGMISGREALALEHTFELRAHARNHNVRLADVAAGDIDGTLTADALVKPRT